MIFHEAYANIKRVKELEAELAELKEENKKLKLWCSRLIDMASEEGVE